VSRSLSLVPERRADLAVLAALAALCAVLASVRWAGPAPFGSDNDEYRMLARSLWEDGNAVVAGVEGTKYPLGYSAVLGALEQVGFAITQTALVLNAVLLAATVAGVYLCSRRFGRVAAVAGALALAASVPLWRSFYAVMPDVALVAIVLAGFAWLLRRPSGWADVVALSAFSGAAVLLKTMGATLAVALAAALLTRPGQRRWAWAPLATAGGLVAAQSVLLSRYPEPVTGYGVTFWQVDPGDASQGRIGVLDLPARMWDQLPLVLAEPGQAFVGVPMPTWVASLLVVVLLVAAGVALPAWRWPLAAFYVSHVVVLSAWNFRGERFGLPFVPLLAVGVAALVALVARRTPVMALGAVAAAFLVGTQVGDLRAEARTDAERYGAYQQASADLRQWARSHIDDDETIASLDYRELSYRLGRPVQPIGYDRSAEGLFAQTVGRDADWLITLRGLYGRREGLADTVVGAYPDRFVPAYSNPAIDVYRIQEE
jgi:hypothetical protein